MTKKKVISDVSPYLRLTDAGREDLQYILSRFEKVGRPALMRQLTVRNLTELVLGYLRTQLEKGAIHPFDIVDETEGRRPEE